MKKDLPDSPLISDNQTQASLVKIGDAAKILGVSIDTLRRWEAKGKIPTVRTPGGTRLYSLDVLQRFGSQKYQPEIENDTTKVEGLEKFSIGVVETNLLLEKKSQEVDNQRIIADLDRLLTIDQPLPKTDQFIDQNPENLSITTYDNSDGDKIYAKIYAFLSPLALNRRLKIATVSSILAGFVLTLIISGLITSLYILKPNQIKSYFNPATDSTFQKAGQMALSPFHNLALKEMQAFFPTQAKELGIIKTNIIALGPSSQVLAASTETNRYLQINADTQLTKNLDVEGAGLFKGYLVAPNIIYGVVAGNNVTVTGGQTPTISVNIPTFLTQITGNSVPSTAGGTGITTYTKGDILYASGTNTLTKLPVGTDGTVLKVSSDGLPSWGTDNAGGNGMTSFSIVGSSGGSQTISDGNTITFSAGDGVSTTSGSGPGLAIGLNLTAIGAAATSTTTSGSGLETSSNGLSMLRGCTNGQLLKWDSTNLEWSCSNDSGANAQSVINVQEGSTTYTGIDTVQFTASDFNVSQAGTTAIIALDYANSHVTRANQAETISGIWNFSSGLNATSIGATTPGTGAFTSLSGSNTITFTGLTAGSGTQICIDGSNNLVTCNTSSSGVTGSGTLNRIPKFTPTSSNLGDSSISDNGTTVTINSEGFTQSGGIANINTLGSSATNIGNSTGALTLASGGTSAWGNTSGNLTISTITSGTLALNSAGALNLIGNANSNLDLGASHTLSIQTSNNGPITTGTGLFTEGGNFTFSGTSARTITGPSSGGLTETVDSGPLSLSTTTSGTLSLSSAGALNLTAGANSTWNFGSNVLNISSASFNTSATGINNTAIGTTTASSGAFTTLSASSSVNFSGLSGGSGSQLCLSGSSVVTCTGGSAVSGSGTQNKVTKWSITGSQLADSSITDTSSSFSFDREVAKTIQIADSTSSNTAGAMLTIQGAAATGIANGGGLSLTAGAAATTGIGGAINLTTGAGGSSSGTSGAINLITGTAASGANTGAVSVRSGNASGSGNSGNLSLDVGSIGAGTAGTVTIAGSNASALALGRSGLTFTLASSNLNVSSVGVITLAGGQTTDITTSTASSANAITVTPGISSAATGSGAGVTIQAGEQSGTTTSTGGTLTLKGGNASGASGTRNGGAVIIDSGSGATTGGAITIAGTNAASLALGRSGITTTISGSTLLAPSTANALQINPFSTSSGNTGEFRLMELAAGGTNYTGFKSPDTLGSNLIYTLPSSDGSTNYVLTTNGSGVLSWQVANGVGGGGGTVTSVGTGNGLTGGPITTTGSISIALSPAATAATASTSSGSGLEFDGSGALTMIRGCSDNNLLTWDATNKQWACNSVSGVGSVSGSGTSGQITYWNGTSSVTGNSNFTFSPAPSTGTSFGVTDSSFAPAAAATGNLVNLTFSNGSVNTSGTATTTGLNIAGTNNSTGSGGTMETYGIRIQNLAGTSGAGTQNNYGIRIGNQGLASTENSYGLYVDAQSGSTASYAAIFAGGRVGIGTTTPSDTLDVNGPLFLEDIAPPGTTTNRLYSVSDVLTWDGDAVCVNNGPCASTGTVGISGTPAAGEIAYWTSSSDIKGNPNYTVADSTLAISHTSTATTSNAYSLTANSLTTGSGLAVTTSSNPAGTGPVSPIAFALTNGNATTATTINGVDIKFTNNPSIAANTENVVRIQNQLTTNLVDNNINDLLLLDNADTNANGSTIVADALRITNSGGISGGITNGINFASGSIGTGLNFSATPSSNYVSGSNWSVTAAGAEVLGSTLNVGGAITAPTSSNTINGLVINSGALSSVTGYTQSSGNFSISGAGTFSTGTGAISLNGDTTIASNKNLTLTSGTGVFTDTYSQSGSSGGNAQVLGVTNANTANAGTTVGGIDITPTNTSTPLSGTNTLNLLAFEVGSALGGSNTTNGINFSSATGYSNFLKTPTLAITSAGAITGATGVSTTTLTTSSTVTLNSTGSGAGSQLCLSSNVVVTCSSGSSVAGSGTQNKITKWSNVAGTQIGDASITDTTSSFSFDKEVAKTIQIADTTSSNTAGALLTILGSGGNGSGAGGALSVTGGAGGATGAGGAVTLTTGTGGATSGTSGVLTLVTGAAASNANTGAVSIKSGNAAGSGNSGNITIDNGSIAGGTAGTISIGSTNTSALNLGRSGVTTTITGPLTQSGGTTNINASGSSATNIGNSTGALTLASGGTSAWTNTAGNLTISTATSGTLALNSAGALNLTGTANSTWDIGNNTLSIQTTNNGPITTGTGLFTEGGNFTFSGTSARTITGPGSGGLTITDAAGNLSLSTTSSGTLSLTSAGALNFTGAANSTWNLGSNSLALTSSNFSISSAGVVTLAGAQATDITTATASTANAIIIQPGVSTTNTGTGAPLTLQAGNESGTTTTTGGLLTLQGGNAGSAGTRTGGGVVIDSGSGATAGGAISIAGTNAASLALGRSGINTTVNGTLRLAGATSGFVGLKAATAAGGTTYTLPSADGSANYVLTTNGSGVLAWQVASGVGGGGGSLIQVGDSNSGDTTAFTSGGTGNSLWFNNSANVGQLTATTLSTTQTWTLPDLSGTFLFLDPSIAQVDSTSASAININKTAVGALLNLTQSTTGVTGSYTTNDALITRNVTSSTSSLDNGGAILKLANPSSFTGTSDTNDPTELLITNATPTGGALFTGNFIDLQRADSAGGAQVSKFKLGATGVLSLAGANGTADITTISGGNSLSIVPLSSSTNSGTGGALNLKAGNNTGTTSNGGSVVVDAGTGTTANGTISIGGTNASSLAIGRNGVNTTVSGSLRLAGSSSGFVGFQAASAAGGTTYTLPSADGSANYVLTTNGSGVLAWQVASGVGGGGGGTVTSSGSSLANRLAYFTTDTDITGSSSFTFTPGVTTGSVLGLSNTAFAVAAAGTGNLSNLTFTNGSTNTSGTAVTTGLNIAATNNAVGSGGTQNTYGIKIADIAGTSGAGTQNNYGIRIGNQGLASTETSYGLLVDAQSGSTNSYAAAFGGGFVGIGTTTPTNPLQIASDIPDVTNGAALNISSNATSTTHDQYGFRATPNVTANPGSVHNYIGFSGGGSTSLTTATNVSLVGTLANTYYGGTGTLGRQIGVDIRNQLDSTGTVNISWGLMVENPQKLGGCTPSCTYGAAAGVNIIDQTSATNNTDLLIGPTSVPTGNFAIYNSSTYDNYIAGKVGIGETAPDEALELNGVLHLDQVSAPGVTADKLYNTGGTLFWGPDQVCTTASACAATGTVTAPGVQSANQISYFTADDVLAGNSNFAFIPGTTTGNTVALTNTSLTTGKALSITGTSTNTANTSGGISQNLFDITNAQSTTALTNGFTGLGVNFTNNPSVAGNTENAVRIQNQVTSNTTDNAVSSLLLLDNADTTGTGALTIVTDALRITNSGAGTAGITNGINFGSTTIATGLNFSSTPATNYVSGSNWSITAAGAEVLGSTLNVGGAITAPTSSNTINGIVINSGALTSVSSLDTISTSATALTFAGAGTISSTTSSAITLDSGTTGNVNVGTGANAKAVTLGNTTSSSSLALKTGTGGLTITNTDTTNGSVFNTTTSTDDQLALLPFVGGSNRFTGTLSSADLTANTKYNFPDNPTHATDTVCLLSLGNCVGSGSGVTESGTNASGQIAYFTTSNNITSDSSYVFTPNTLTGNTLALTNSSLTTGKALSVTATNTDTANTSGGVTQNLFDITNAQSTAALTNGFNGLGVNFTNNPSVAGNTENAVRIQNQVTSNTTDNAVSSLLLLDNADTTGTGALTVVTDALRITNSGAGTAGITNGINFGSTTIATGINFSSTPSTNYISGSNFSVTAAGAEVLGSTLNVGGAITAPTSSNTINGLIINSGALSGITGYTQTSGTFSSTLTTTGSALFSSSTANSDSLALLPQSSTATNSFTGTITTADLTANRTYTLPDSTGTICTTTTCLTSGTGVSSVTGTTNQITASPTTGAVILSLPSAITTPGSLTTTSTLTSGTDFNVNGNTTIGDATTDRLTVTSQILGGSPLVFQGATDNSFTTTLAFTDPTTPSKTITFPNATGTVAVSASSPITLSAAGDIGCSTCLTSSTGVTTATGTANQIFVNGDTAAHSGAITLTLPSAVTTPGSLTTTTSLTAGSGFTLTTGALSLTATSGSEAITGYGTSSKTSTTTTGNINTLADSSFTAAASATGNLLNLTFTNGSTNTSGTSTTTGLNIAGTNSAAGSGGTMETYGIRLQDIAGTPAAGTQNNYGIRIGNQGQSGAEASYGLYVDSQSGSTANYAAIFAGGNVGIATTTPRTPLDVLSTSGAQARLTYTDNSVYTALATNSSGNLTVTPTGGTSTFNTTTSTDDQLALLPFVGGSGRFTGTITSADLTAARTWTLPDATGTICVSGQTCALSGNVTDTGQVTNALTKFTSTTDQITASHVTDDGTTIAVGSTSGAAALNERVGTGNYTLDGVTGSTYDLGTSTTTGTFALGGTAQTGTLTLGRSTAGQTINIGHATVATGNTQTIGIGDAATGTGKDVITVGNTNGASSVAVNAGSGNIALGATSGAINLTTTTSGNIALSAASTLSLATSGGNNNITVAPNGTGSVQITSGTTSGTGTTSGLSLASSTLTTGHLAEIASTSTAGGASGSNYLLYLTSSGANSNTAHTSYGLSSTITNTNGTSGTNIAAILSASGATTANYALVVPSGGGNVGIGTSTPVASALVDLSSTNQGFLTPRMTGAQRDAISSPATGLLVYNTDTTSFNYWNGSAWTAIGSGTVVHLNDIVAANNTNSIDNTNNAQVWDWSTLSTQIAMKLSGGGATALTTGNVLQVAGPTGAAALSGAAGGVVNLTAAGNYTSANNAGLLNLNANATNGGVVQNIEADALTTGTALRIGSTGTGLTTGSLLAVSSATTGAIATNGAVNFTASGAYSSASNVGFVNIAANSTQTGTIESIQGNALTTGSALFVSSTSTALAGTTVTGSGLLGNFEWNPGSATTATGDLFRLAIGSNATISGNIFDIVANSSSLFSINPQAVTTSLPFNNTAPGDLSVAYDINLTNPTASYIKSAAPLYLQAGETFGSSDLTLKTFNSGNVVVDLASTGNLMIPVGKVGIGNSTNPTYALDVRDSQATSYVMRIINTATSNGAKGLIIDLGAPSASRSISTRFVDFATSGTVAGKIQGSASGVAYTTTAADYAEYFKDADVNDQAQSGEVVSFANGSRTVTRSTNSQDQKVAGIVSSGAGFIGGGPACDVGDTNCDQNYESSHALVSMNGQVPLKVSTENGPIEIGDFLTTSSTPGVAMKATNAGQMIARALENYNSSGINKITVLVYNGYADPNNTLANLQLDGNGNLITSGIKTNKLELSGANASLVVNGTSIDASTLLQSGQLASNITALQNQYQSLANAINGLTDQAQETSDKLASLESNTDVLGAQVATQSAQLADVNSKVASQSANIAQVSDQLASSSAQIASNSASLGDLSSQVNALLASLANGNNEASNSGNQQPPADNLMSGNTLFATESATLSNLTVDKVATVSGELQAYDATVSNVFKSLGESFLGNTTVAGNFSVDGTLSLTDNSLNVIGTPVTSGQTPTDGILYLQNSSLANLVDIFNGKVTIDKDGNVKATTFTADQIKVNDNKSAGEITLPAGQSEIAVFNDYVKSNSIITLTPETVTDQTLAVTDKVDDSGFVVKTSLPAAQDIKFSYLVIGVNSSP